MLAPTLFVLWTMTTATVYRAVLRPGEHGWHLFKLGPDEARIAALSAVETVLLALLGGVPAYLLLVLLNPIFEAAPGFTRGTAVVRLPRHHPDRRLAGGAPLAAAGADLRRARISDRRLLGASRVATIGSCCWATCWWCWRCSPSWLVSLAVLAAFGALAEAAIQWRGGGLTRSVALWVLVVVLAVLTAVVFVVPIILVCGCQAYAYRAIVDERTEPAGDPVAA